jgi:hypothetical protein
MLVRPTFRQVLKCARNMRPLDKREMTALLSDDPYDVTFSVMEFGTPAWAALHGDVPAYAFGVQPRDDAWAFWGFGTSYFPLVAFEVTAFIRRVVAPMMRRAGVKQCEVLSLADKTDAHRWLKFIGAVEEDTIEDYRCTGETFKLFVWR